jgi:hypothetical protein
VANAGLKVDVFSSGCRGLVRVAEKGVSGGVDGRQFKVERANIGRAERGDAEGVQSRKAKSRSLTPFGMTT